MYIRTHIHKTHHKNKRHNQVGLHTSPKGNLNHLWLPTALHGGISIISITVYDNTSIKLHWELKVHNIRSSTVQKGHQFKQNKGIEQSRTDCTGQWSCHSLKTKQIENLYHVKLKQHIVLTQHHIHTLVSLTCFPPCWKPTQSHTLTVYHHSCTVFSEL